jgi:MFS transporter, putative metabolite:H+ symporter
VGHLQQPEPEAALGSHTSSRSGDIRSGERGDLVRRLEQLPLSGWHRMLTVLVGIGSFFDLYEVFLGGVLASVLAGEWKLSSTGKSVVIASAFLGMFVGANILSSLADRLGRRRVFMINLASYALFSFATAFAPNLPVFVVLRFLSGLGMGAELVLVDTYLAEFLPARSRGRYISWAYVIGFLGVPLAALFGARVVAKADVLGLAGWRWLLIAGGLGTLFVWAVRSRLPESPRWLMVKGREEEAERVVAQIEAKVPNAAPAATAPVAETTALASAATAPAAEAAEQPFVGRNMRFTDMFRGEYRKRTVMLWIFQVLQTVGYYGFGTMAPIVLAAKGYSVTSSLGYAALSYTGYPIGALVAIPLVERFERKTLIVASALGIAGFGLVFGLATSTALIVAAGFLLTVCSNVFSNSYHIYQTEIFPTRLRSTAIGMAYSLSRLASAVLPFVAIAALDRFGAGGVFMGSAVLMGVLCLDVGLLGPRTTGRSLEQAALARE